MRHCRHSPSHISILTKPSTVFLTRCSKKKNSKLKNYVSVVEREAMKRARLREIKKSGADMSKFIMTGKLEDEPLFPTYNRLAKEVRIC